MRHEIHTHVCELIMDQELEEFENVYKRRKHAYQLTYASFDTLESCLIQMTDHPNNQSKRKELLDIWKETSSKLSNEWKENYALIAKLSKILDKRFKSEVLKDITASNDDKSIDLQKDSLHTTIVNHLYRQGRFDLATTLALESKCTINGDISKGFHNLHDIVSRIKYHQDLGPAQE